MMRGRCPVTRAAAAAAQGNRREATQERHRRAGGPEATAPRRVGSRVSVDCVRSANSRHMRECVWVCCAWWNNDRTRTTRGVVAQASWPVCAALPAEPTERCSRHRQAHDAGRAVGMRGDQRPNRDQQLRLPVQLPPPRPHWGAETRQARLQACSSRSERSPHSRYQRLGGEAQLSALASTAGRPCCARCPRVHSWQVLIGIDAGVALQQVRVPALIRLERELVARRTRAVEPENDAIGGGSASAAGHSALQRPAAQDPCARRQQQQLRPVGTSDWRTLRCIIKPQRHGPLPESREAASARVQNSR